MPKNLSNIIVSIHAIATFQALHDYLRPRVAGLMSGGSRLSGMLAALAASGLAGPSSAAPPSDNKAVESSASDAGVNRRRSLRLSAKKSGQLKDPVDGAGESASAPAGSSSLESTEAAAGESAPSDTVVNEDDFAAEFTDEEVDVDAEVCFLRHSLKYQLTLC